MYGYFTERSYTGDLPYTDLAAERRRADLEIPGVEYHKENCRVGYWERIRISSKKGAESIGRPMGMYDTLQMKRADMLGTDEIEDAKNEIASGICRRSEKKAGKTEEYLRWSGEGVWFRDCVLLQEIDRPI